MTAYPAFRKYSAEVAPRVPGRMGGAVSSIPGTRLIEPTCAEVVQETHTGEGVNQRFHPIFDREPSHIEFQGHRGSTTLRTTSALDLCRTVGFINGTVTKTTLRPSLACLVTNSLTPAMSCSREGGGGCVAKYSSAEKRVGGVCMNNGVSDEMISTKALSVQVFDPWHA